MVTEDDVAESVLCGPDIERYVATVEEFTEAGFDHVYFHQVGRDQEGLFRFFREELASRLDGA